MHDFDIDGLDFSNAIGRIIPNEQQTMLINAAILPMDVALDSWNKWKNYRNFNSEKYKSANNLSDIYDILDDGCQRLLPIIFRNLESSGDYQILLIKSYYKHIWVKNQQALAIVSNIITDLKILNVDCIVLKGLAIIIGYYKDPGLRVSGDYDLLIPHSQKDFVINYFKEKWKVDLSFFEKLQVDEFHALNLKLPNGLEIDVHWNLNYEDGLANNTNILFENAVEKVASNKKIYKILSPTYQIFHNITHGISISRNYTIRWITDCVIINKHETIDWKAVSDLCLQYNYKLPFAIACKVLPSFGIKIPSAIVNDVSTWSFTKNELDFYNLIAGYKGKKDSWYNKIVGTYFYKKAMYNQFRKGKTKQLFMVWYLKSFILAVAIWLKKRL
jgi:hypothetical protein